MSIIFYYADYCGYCKQAKQILASEINARKIIIRPHTEAKNAPGFPYFVNTKSGTTSAGCPESAADLYSKLSQGGGQQPRQQPQQPQQQGGSCNGGYGTLGSVGRDKNENLPDNWWIGIL